MAEQLSPADISLLEDVVQFHNLREWIEEGCGDYLLSRYPNLKALAQKFQDACNEFDQALADAGFEG